MNFSHCGLCFSSILQRLCGSLCDVPGGEEAVSVAAQGGAKAADKAASSGMGSNAREYGHTYDASEVMLMKMFLSVGM